MDSCIASPICCFHPIPLHKALFSFGVLYMYMYIFFIIWHFVFLHNRHDQLRLAVLLVLYIPMYLSQLFTWIVFVVITCVMCHRSCHKDSKNNTTQYSQFKKNLGILVLLFTFLGLPWLFIVTGSFVSIVVRNIKPAVVIIDALQGPALFVIRVVRLREARQFWKRLLCCKPCAGNY